MRAPGTVSLREKSVVLFVDGKYPQQTFQFLSKNMVVSIGEDGKQHGYQWQRRGWRVTWSEIAGGFGPSVVDDAMAERLGLAYRMMNDEKNRAALERIPRNARGKKNGTAKRT